MVGELLPRLMATFAQLESKNLSVRELRKHEETARKGHRSGGGTRPFGLTADWSELKEPEAQLVRDAVDRILAGESMYAIAGEWNAAGVRTPTGRHWTVQLVSSMLRAPRIAGLREHHGEIVAAGTWPAIVSAEAYERLRATFRARRRPGAPGRFLLSGMVRCATCGSTLVVRRRHKDKARFYGCEKVNGRTSCGGVHAAAEPLEQVVTGAVLYRLEASAGPLAAALAEHEQNADSAADLEAIRADESALEQLSRDHYADRIIGRAEYLAAHDVLTARVEAARGRLGHHNGSAVVAGALGRRRPLALGGRGPGVASPPTRRPR